MEGEILVDVSVTPRRISFGRIVKKETATKEFELKINEPNKIKITSVTIDRPEFSLLHIEGNPAGNSKYQVKFNGADKIGRIPAKIIIKMEGSDVPEITVPTNANIVGDLKYQKSLHFNKKDGQFPKREFILTSRSGKSVEIKKIVNPDGALRWDLKTPKGEQAVLVAEVADPTADYKKPLNSSFEVYTSDPEEPVLQIRFVISERNASSRMHSRSLMKHRNKSKARGQKKQRFSQETLKAKTKEKRKQ